MLTFDDIKTLVANNEGAHIEFKKTTGQLDRGMETLCAFLNGSGGTVLFGITDDGEIKGQEVADSTKRIIAEHIRDLSPSAAVSVSYINIPDTDGYVISLHVEDSKMERPYMYKGRAYMRVESTTLTMPQDMYNNLLFERDGSKYRWESMVNEDLKTDDLDENEILKTVRLGVENGRLPETTGNDVAVVLKRFDVMDDSGLLKHAAAILFSKKEYGDYFQCMVRLARFQGTDKSEFIDNKQVRGNIFMLLDASMAFVFKHLSLSGHVDGLEREERLSVPYKAVREAIINALCHRDYRNAGESVGIAIYDDRVVIENPGTLPRGWKVEDLKLKKLSAAHNPIIANVLYKRKLLESWGRGISLMIDECIKYGLAEPVFDNSCGFFSVTFWYNHISTTQVPHKHHTSTTQVEQLVQILGDNECSVKEIMSLMGLNNRSYFTKKYLQPAVAEGWIAPLFPDTINSPKQKYYLTEKGKAFLNRM